MGVTGLWRLIEPTGKPVPIETLENKVLAVDISIWLHQMVKGYQDAKGAPLPNAHLMGLFQRLCKLLYFRIKPIFVFDGGIPNLKRQTIAKRQVNKSKYNSESERLKRELALLIGKKTAIGALLGKQISPKKSNAPQNDDDLFKLPAMPQREEETDTESDEDESSSASTVDLHTVDLESENFKNMPVKEKYDLLIELKETRKMNSWGKLHTLPKKSDNFSDFQMQRLLKRRKVQECIEETEKEMGDVGMSFNDLEALLNEEGIDTKIEELPTRRIASDKTTRFLLINNVKQTLAEAKKLKEQEALKDFQNTDSIPNENNSTIENEKNDELEDDLQKAIKMSLECVDEPGTSATASTSKGDESWTSFLTDSEHSDASDDDDFAPPTVSTAKAYIMQYSDFTHKAIDEIVSTKGKKKDKTSEKNVDDIIHELNQENSIIEYKVDLTNEEDFGNNMSNQSNVANNDSAIIINTNKSEPEADKNISNNEINTSVVCVETTNDEIINLDTTTEEFPSINDSINFDSKLSSSSDDEFEEVSETETKPPKPVVQLTLNMNEQIEDDIFADVFEDDKGQSNNIIDIAKTQSMNKKVNKKEIAEIPDKELLIKDTKDNINKNKETLDDKKDFVQDPGEIIDNNIQVKDSAVQECIENKERKELTEDNIKINASSSKSENLPIEPKLNVEPSKEKPIREPISKEQLQTMETEVDKEEEMLLQEKGRLDRIGRNISEQMTQEAQELLQIFGIPYVVAPMEAEAQCAFLEAAKLTDGTITDDSDIWLFGGKTVYKNFFNQKKHVLQFLSEKIEKSFNLTREQLILFALLVGSDYTTGVTGVGPVTAIEILASFPFNKKKVINETLKEARYQELVTGLQEFKQWVRAGRRTDNISLKNKLKNVTLNDDFPSVRVVQAYLEPNVEKSDEKFTWGEIDITILRDYTKKKFGWSQNKLDEIINPVLKRLLERKTQKTVHDYFKRKTEFDCIDAQVSKRVKAAIQKLDPNSDTLNEEMLPPPESNKQPNKNKSKRKLVKNDEINHISKVVEVATVVENKTDFSIIIPKTDKCQEIIPQREKVKQSMLENKLKAIEVFRKTKIDRKRKFTKKKSMLPKDQAELSESSDSD
ncbi:DNA repair protein UVH3 isoform X1 [Colias croceus]|uniref:DNA repair protein UVH3 isoform X1 n=2 Tax=Colias crocea TaxID=72248 RepID=UPI001E27CEF8|nr:DNA repair protein UVH3 isoform X1 [Colias croceus]